MALVDPVKIYAAASNVQAQMTCDLLQAAGIEAFAGEDSSPAGVWLGGTVPGVFDAGVFVSHVDSERAIDIIREHERLEAERSRSTGADVEATCEECGKTAKFPAAQHGTVQDCPHCGALVDVGRWTCPAAGRKAKSRRSNIHPAVLLARPVRVFQRLA